MGRLEAVCFSSPLPRDIFQMGVLNANDQDWDNLWFSGEKTGKMLCGFEQVIPSSDLQMSFSNLTCKQSNKPSQLSFPFHSTIHSGHSIRKKSVGKNMKATLDERGAPFTVTPTPQTGLTSVAQTFRVLSVGAFPRVIPFVWNTYFTLVLI